MPDLGDCEYLIGWIMEIGLYKNTGFGVSAIDWGDIDCWARLTQTEITPSEALSLIGASRAYVSEYSQGSNPQRQAPDDDRGYGYSPEVVAANLDANIMSLIKEQNKEPSK